MLLPALRCLSQHGRYEHAVSFAAGMRAGGWRGAGERAIKFAAGISRATNTPPIPLKCRLYLETLVTLINAASAQKRQKRAFMTQKRAFMTQKRAIMTQKRALVSHC
jgi:hypothetical protein